MAIIEKELTDRNVIDQETVDEFRNRIQELLRQYVIPSTSKSDVETQILVDTTNDHYQLVDVGWHKDQRIYCCVLHIDIKDGKVWIQQNMTDQHVAEELVALGIPPGKIVLGFHPPYVRPHTGFAVN